MINFGYFSSNTGSTAISRLLYEIRQQGIDRGALGLKPFEEAINRDVFNSEGGLADSDIVSRGFIDYYVPFFPLEATHLQSCILAYLEQKWSNRKFEESQLKALIETILQETSFNQKYGRMFATAGCRLISAAVSMRLSS